MRRSLLALFMLLVLLASGCVSGQTIKRQAAESLAEPNITENLSLAEYEDNAPDECACPDSIRTCPDGFNASCLNACTSGACNRCLPDCSGHDLCNSSWFCGAWSECLSGKQARSCIDSGWCNKTVLNESRACETDSCSSSSDCPQGTGCSPYICSGSPRKCVQVVIVPCCGDGLCEGNENSTCISDCPSQGQNQGQQNSTPPAGQPNVSITFVEPNEEWVKIENSGSTSQNMTGWLINDTLASPKTVFVFPEFVLHPGSFVMVLKGSGENNSTHLFRNNSQNVWNNDGDTALLINGESVVSSYSYSA